MQPVGEHKDVCEDCVLEGTRWVHLRECLVCGRTLCCDNSPRRHMRAHWQSVGHAVMKGVSPGDDWTWCFSHDAPIREAAGGSGHLRRLRRGRRPGDGRPHRRGASIPRPDYFTADDFPLGDWVGYVRELHADKELDPADEEAIEAIPAGAGAAADEAATWERGRQGRLTWTAAGRSVRHASRRGSPPSTGWSRRAAERGQRWSPWSTSVRATATSCGP